MTAADPGGVDIREAAPADAATIHRLIVELAVYEREPDAVEATPETLAAQLAAERPPFECVLASVELDGTRRDVGMALFFPTFSTWTGRPGIHLEDLFVERRARGRGVGLALLRHLAALTIARGGRRLEWAVLDWNRPSIDFYESLDAVAMDEWVTYRLTGDPLAAVADG